MDKETYIKLYYDEIMNEKYESKIEDEDDEKNLEKVYGVTPGIDFPITLHKRIE